MEKYTKVQKYDMLAAMLAQKTGDEAKMLADFVAAEKAALERKAAKAKEFSF